MKYLLKIIIAIFISIFAFSDSSADSLLESLTQAYLNNSKLNAERANLRAVNEHKKEAISEFLPTK